MNNGQNTSYPEESTVVTNEVTTSTTTSTPPINNSSPINTNGNKKLNIPRRVVVTLFGIMFLIMAVGAGLVLVSQQQHISQKAAGLPDGASSGCCSGDGQCQSWFGSGSTCSNANGACASGNQCRGSSCTPTHQCTNSDCGVSNGCGQTCNGGCGAVCGNGVCDSGENTSNCSQDCPAVVCGGLNQPCCTGQQNSCNTSSLACDTATQKCITANTGSNWQYANNCIQVNSGTVNIQRFSGPSCPTTQSDQGTQSVGVGTYCPTPSQGSCQQVDVVGSRQGVCSCNTSTNPPTTPPTTSPTSSPTVPPVSAQCTNLQAYDASWNLLTAAQLSQLQTGSVVRFAVTGTTTGTFDKARFTINNQVTPTESTNLKPGTVNTYYLQYTIPANVTSFTVKAEMHSVDLSQWF